MKVNRPHSRWYTCPDCGKRTYLTRCGARKVMRFMKRCNHLEPSDKRLNVYRCGAGWHIGHTA